MLATAFLIISSENPQRDSPFFRLPPELRNKIYRLLLGGITVHVGGSPTRITVKRRIVGVVCIKEYCELHFAACWAGDSLGLLRQLTGAAHSHSSLISTSGGDWAPCDTNFINYCHAKSFSLDLQLLRVCRQVHNETALIPYAENNFIFADGIDSDFRRVFRKRFNRNQRGAIQTAAVLNIGTCDIEALPRLLHGVKRLWMRSSFSPFSLRRFEATNFSEFEQIRSLRLVGAGLSCDRDREEDRDLLERTEMALLRRSQLKCHSTNRGAGHVATGRESSQTRIEKSTFGWGCGRPFCVSLPTCTKER